MAAAVDRMTASTHNEFVEGWTDIVREANVFLYKVAEEGGIVRKSGEQIEWRVRDVKDTDTVSAWGGGMEPIPFVQVNKWKVATIRFGGYAGSYTLAKTDEWKNDGPNGIFDLQKGLAETTLSDLQELLEDDMLANNGSDGISVIGVPGFMDIGDSTPDLTYAGQVQGTVAQWSNQYKASSGSANIVADLIDAVITASRGPDRRRGKPNLIIGKRAFWATYNKYLVNSVRYRDEKMGNAGFENVMVCNVPFVWSDSMDQTGNSVDISKQIFVLNTRYMRIVKSNPGEGIFVPISDDRVSPVAKVFAYISQFNLVCLSPRQQLDLDGTANTWV